MKNLRISLHVVPLILAATFYLSLSGFQCASSMMNTADLAVNSGDWAKAKQATEEELALRPTNGKAWFLLGQSEYNLGNLAGMSKAFDKAEEHKASEAGPVSNREMGMMSRMTADAWNQIVIRSRDASRKKQYAVALAGLDTADMVQAGNPIAIRDRGLLLAASGKADEAAATDIEYIAATKGVIEAGVKEGLELGLSQDDVRRKLGEPQIEYNMSGSGQPSNSDVFISKGFAVYYGSDDAGQKIVSGWNRVNPTAPSFFNYALSSDPYFNRANVLRSADKFDEAIGLLELSEEFDPKKSSEFGNLLGQIYIDAGRVEEAGQEIERRIALDPENVRLRVRYSVLLYNTRDTAGAINALKQALKIKSLKQGSEEHNDILYNLAAYNKNWGYELDQVSKDLSISKARPLQDEALERYNEALGYFLQVDELAGKEFDSDLLYSIGNLYAIAENQTGLKEIIGRFEKVQAAEANAESYAFWRSLARLYIWSGDTENASKANETAKKYK